MLVARPEPVRSSYYSCLDLIQVTLEAGHKEDAILLWIGSRGGLVQTESEARPGSPLAICTGSTSAAARVESCVADEYGYLVEFTVPSGENWFPRSYRPRHLREDSCPAVSPRDC